MSTIYKDKSLVAIEFDEQDAKSDQVDFAEVDSIPNEILESNKDFENELLSEVINFF